MFTQIFTPAYTALATTARNQYYDILVSLTQYKCSNVTNLGASLHLTRHLIAAPGFFKTEQTEATLIFNAEVRLW